MLAVRDAFQGEVGAPEAADQAVGDGLVGAALQAGELMQAEAWAAGQVVAPAQQAGQPSRRFAQDEEARTSGSSKRSRSSTASSTAAAGASISRWWCSLNCQCGR